MGTKCHWCGKKMKNGGVKNYSGKSVLGKVGTFFLWK